MNNNPIPGGYHNRPAKGARHVGSPSFPLSFPQNTWFFTILKGIFELTKPKNKTKQIFYFSPNLFLPQCSQLMVSPFTSDLGIIVEPAPSLSLLIIQSTRKSLLFYPNFHLPSCSPFFTIPTTTA